MTQLFTLCYNFLQMKKNTGITDRIIRFVLMDLLLGMSLWGLDVPMWFANTSFILSGYLVFTMLFAYSPLYAVIGFSTLEEKTGS